MTKHVHLNASLTKIISQVEAGLFFSVKPEKATVKTVLTSLIILSAIARGAAQGISISPQVMGQAYWWTDWHDVFGNNQSPFSGTVWQDVRNSKVIFCRAGGKGYNVGDEKPQRGHEVYYVAIVDDTRKNGCEPVLIFIPQ